MSCLKAEQTWHVSFQCSSETKYKHNNKNIHKHFLLLQRVFSCCFVTLPSQSPTQLGGFTHVDTLGSPEPKSSTAMGDTLSCMWLYPHQTECFAQLQMLRAHSLWHTTGHGLHENIHHTWWQGRLCRAEGDFLRGGSGIAATGKSFLTLSGHCKILQDHPKKRYTQKQVFSYSSQGLLQVSLSNRWRRKTLPLPVRYVSRPISQ